MSQLPSKGRKKLVIDNFEGINEVYAEQVIPRGMCRSSYGLIDTGEEEGRDLTRLGGCLPLLNRSSTHPAVMSIGALNFASSTHVVLQGPNSSVSGYRAMIEGFDNDPYVTSPDGIREYGI